MYLRDFVEISFILDGTASTNSIRPTTNCQLESDIICMISHTEIRFLLDLAQVSGVAHSSQAPCELHRDPAMASTRWDWATPNCQTCQPPGFPASQLTTYTFDWFYQVVYFIIFVVTLSKQRFALFSCYLMLLLNCFRNRQVHCHLSTYLISARCRLQHTWPK